MNIKPEALYSTLEAAEILNVKPRRLQRLAKKHYLKKVDNRYLFSGSFLISHFKKIIQAATDVDANKTQPREEFDAKMTQEIASLKDSIEKLKKELQEKKERNKKLKKKVASLKEKVFKIADNERIEVFTNEEYQKFEARLKEWFTQQDQIQNQEENLRTQKRDSSELIKHYQNQFEYQKEQSSKILEIHQKLIDTIKDQNTLAAQRSFIEAKDKGHDKN